MGFPDIHFFNEIKIKKANKNKIKHKFPSFI